MWTPENRPKYDRSKLRYPSDLTDEEWAIIAPLIPPAKRGGNRRTVDECAVVNGVMYIRIKLSYRSYGDRHLQNHPQSRPIVFEANLALEWSQQRAHQA